MSLGYGFPATFGFVIAGIIVVVLIQFLALREQRKEMPQSSSEQASSVGCNDEKHEAKAEDVIGREDQK